MRVPPQRSSRSNTATATTSGGKRLSSTSISASSCPALSAKKRKLQPETLSGNTTAFKTTSVGDASTSNPNSKRKQPLPNIRKTLHHSKKSDVAILTKSLKSDVSAKKPQSNKSSNVPLVGLKKIKIKEGRVTIKKILVTAAATKSQKKLAKPVTKTVPTKKQTNTNTNSKKVISAIESLSALPAADDQAPSGSGKYFGEAEDQHFAASQKKTQYRSQPSSKPDTKKGKTVTGKSKNPTLISVPVPLTRTKKLEQRQKVKSVKKICLKKYPATRHVMVMQVEQEAATAGKKKIPTRRKQVTGENSGANDTSSHVTSKASGSPIRDSQLSGGADNLESNIHVTSQAPEKSISKGSVKKAKDEESAIKKNDKKKVAKKKPKMEGVGKGNETGIEGKPAPTKDKSEVSVPKKEGKIGNKEDVTSKVKCVKKKNKPKSTDALLSKGKPTKKSPVLKLTKVISTKVNKSKMPRITSNPKVAKKLQQSKKKMSKTVMKNVTKVQFSADSTVDPRQEEDRKPQDDEDSSTSDEITLDVLLLRQQQMKQENIISDEPPIGQRSQYEEISGPSSPIETGKQIAAQNVEIKPSLPLITSVKVEESVPSPALATLSPSTVNTSDDEDLKSIKNRIKIKLEENITEIGGEKLSAHSEKNTKRKPTAAKLRSDDSFTNRGKSEGVNIKKEPKDDTEYKKSESDIKVTSDSRGKERVKKLLSVKRSRVDGGKNGGSGSDTDQRARRMKLFGFWSGPKRHRVASLNALAKVHCLYENESRGALLGICGTSGGSQRGSKPPPSPENDTVIPTRTLRSAPGLRGMGKHWDMHNASSTSSSSPSSDDNESNSDSYISCPTVPPASSKQKRRQPKMGTSTAAYSIKKKSKQIKNMKKVVKRRRNRCELMMDLKDMVVRKRMASLNASAILAASYSVEKRAVRNVKEDGGAAVGADANANNAHQVKKKTKKRLVTKKVVEVEDDSSSISSEIEIEECDVEGRGSTRSVIEVRTTPSGGPNSNKKVAVIVNQDTDVTITGVYVNSTTRSTHHEGFCSIAGMQYRISSTSHTQTEATAVATETVLHTSTAAEHVS